MISKTWFVVASAAGVLLAGRTWASEDAQKVAPVRPGPCVVNKSARVEIAFERVALVKVAQVVADMTCRSFVIPRGFDRLPITIVTPQHSTHTMDKAYELFLAALRSEHLDAKQTSSAVTIEVAQDNHS